MQVVFKEFSKKQSNREVNNLIMTDDNSISLNDWFCSVVAQTGSYLGQHGFRRSGKTNSFYIINSDRTKGCLIVFRQSLDNTPEYKKFGINFICLTQNDTPDRSRITVNLLRQNTALNGLPIDVFQIDETLINNVTPGSYFAKSIRPKLDRILSECKAFGII